MEVCTDIQASASNTGRVCDKHKKHPSTSELGTDRAKASDARRVLVSEDQVGDGLASNIEMRAEYFPAGSDAVETRSWQQDLVTQFHGEYKPAVSDTVEIQFCRSKEQTTCSVVEYRASALPQVPVLFRQNTSANTLLSSYHART